MLGAPLVEWDKLGQAAGAATLGALVVVCAFAVALTGAVRMGEARRGGTVAPAWTVILVVAGGVVCLGAVAVGVLAMLHKT